MAGYILTRKVLPAAFVFATIALLTGCDQKPSSHTHHSTTDHGTDGDARTQVLSVIQNYVGTHEPFVQTQVDPSNGRAVLKGAIARGQVISPGSVICRADLDQVANATTTRPTAPFYWIRWAFMQGIVQHEVLTARAQGGTWSQDCAFVAPQMWQDKRIFKPADWELGVILADAKIADVTTFNPYKAQIAGLGAVDGYYVEFTASDKPTWAGYVLAPQTLSATAHVIFRPDTRQYQIVDITIPSPQITLQTREDATARDNDPTASPTMDLTRPSASSSNVPVAPSASSISSDEDFNCNAQHPCTLSFGTANETAGVPLHDRYGRTSGIHVCFPNESVYRGQFVQRLWLRNAAGLEQYQGESPSYEEALAAAQRGQLPASYDLFTVLRKDPSLGSVQYWFTRLSHC